MQNLGMIASALVGHRNSIGRARNAPEPREVKTRSENVAALRAAVIVMFPPGRRRLLRVLKAFLERADYSAMARWLLSAERTNSDLQSVKWMVDLLSRLSPTTISTDSASKEAENVQGIRTLVSQLKGHTRLDAKDSMPRVRNRRGSITALTASGLKSVEESKHMAELLEITGASKISVGVQLQLTAMKTMKESTIVAQFKKMRAAEINSESSRPASPTGQGTMATVLAANRLKKSLTKKAGISKQSTMGAVADLLFSNADGRNAGPLRWVMHRRLLLDVWEWAAFHCQPWEQGLLLHVACQAAAEYPDLQMKQLMEFVFLKTDDPFADAPAMSAIERAAQLVSSSSKQLLGGGSLRQLQRSGSSAAWRAGAVVPIPEGSMATRGVEASEEKRELEGAGQIEELTEVSPPAGSPGRQRGTLKGGRWTTRVAGRGSAQAQHRAAGAARAAAAGGSPVASDIVVEDVEDEPSVRI